MRLFRILLDPKGTEGDGNPVPTPAPAPTPEPESKGPDLAKAVENLIAKHGDGTAALRVLLAENYEYRDTIRDLKGRAPGEGSRVLTPDEAKALDAYAALGKPEDIRKIKGEHGTLAAELAGLRREKELRRVAAAANVDEEVLGTLAGSLDFSHTVKVRDPRTGKETEVPAVKDGEAEPVAFDDFAKARWGKFLPALRPANAAGPDVPPRRNSAPLPPVNPQKREPSLVR